MVVKRALFEPDRFYHIYTHAVGKDNLFYSDENYKYFLRQIQKYLIDFVDIYSYCLMPNHFHLVIKVPNNLNSEDINKTITNQFSKLLNSYAQAINKQEKRMGSLFVNRYKRKLVDSESHLINLIKYVHFNPADSGFSSNVKDWKYSSFNEIVIDNSSLIKVKEVLELFDDLDNFIYCHRRISFY